MRLLLDTNILLWIVTDSPRLSSSARRRIEMAETVFVSAVSIWEVAIKAAVRKFDADVNLIVSDAVRNGFQELAVTWEHSRAVRGLPLHHKDPFDRMLVAQAIAEPLHLLTSDRILEQYGEIVIGV